MNPNTHTIATAFPILAEQGKNWVLIGDMIAEIARSEEFEVCFDVFTSDTETETYEVSTDTHTLYITVGVTADSEGELVSRWIEDYAVIEHDTNETIVFNPTQQDQLEQAIIKNIVAG